MSDLVFVVLTVAFFALSLLALAGCDALIQPDAPDSTAQR